MAEAYYRELPKWLARLRAITFLLLVLSTSIPLALLQLVMLPCVSRLDPNRVVYHRMMAWLARFCVGVFIGTNVSGLENLPRDRPTVLALNHQSFLDAFLLAGVSNINFKVSFKRSLLFYPGVGQLFWLSGHLPVQRGNRASGAQLLENCVSYIRKGVSVVFFPEGTRRNEEVLGKFHRGAFKVAKDTNVEVVPITVNGARQLLSPFGLPELHQGRCSITIHKPIASEGLTEDELNEKTRQVILQELIAHPPNNMDEAKRD